MYMKDVRVGQTYAYAEDYSRKCRFNVNEVTVQPVVITDKSVQEVYTTDNCGRLIPTRKTILKGKLYGIPATDMRALDLDLVEKDNQKLIQVVQVKPEDIVSPWEPEVERARYRAAIKVKAMNAQRYLGILACAVLDQMRLQSSFVVQSNPSVLLDIWPLTLSGSSPFMYSKDEEVTQLLRHQLKWSLFSGLVAFNRTEDDYLSFAVTMQKPSEGWPKKEAATTDVAASMTTYNYVKVFGVNLAMLFGATYCKPPAQPPKSYRKKNVALWTAKDRAANEVYFDKKLLPWFERVRARLAKSTQEERHHVVELGLNQLRQQVMDFTGFSGRAAKDIPVGKNIPMFNFTFSSDVWQKELKARSESTLALPSAAQLQTLKSSELRYTAFFLSR